MRTPLTMLGALLALSGCSDDPKAAPDAGLHEAGASPDAEACEHLTKGPFVELQAAPDPKTAPELKADHQAYRVALLAGAAGYVRMSSGVVGEIELFLDADVPLGIEDDKGAIVAIEKSVTWIAACTIVKARHTIPVTVGIHRFKLGPAAALSRVTIVAEGASHAH